MGECGGDMGDILMHYTVCRCVFARACPFDYHTDCSGSLRFKEETGGFQGSPLCSGMLL